MSLSISKLLNESIRKPKRILFFAIVFLMFTLVFDGSLWRLYTLHHQQQSLVKERIEAEIETERLQFQIQRARDPKFLEQQAREKFDWVEEDELVFLFPDS